MHIGGRAIGETLITMGTLPLKQMKEFVMINTFIAGMVEQEQYGIVVIIDKANARVLPVRIGKTSLWEVKRLLDKFPTMWPSTAHIFTELMAAGDVELEAILLSHTINDLFCGTIRLRRGTEVWEVEAGARNALALAAHTDCPLYVAETLMVERSVPLDPPLAKALQAGQAVEEDLLARIVAATARAKTSDGVFGIDEIVDGLYVGGWIEGIEHTSTLRKMGITHILQLSTPHPAWPDDFVVCDNALNDGTFVPRERLERGVDFVRAQREAGHTVLVACAAGISRSTTFVIAYLLRALGYDLYDAWQLVHSRHPKTWPACEMWESLITHYDLPYTMDDVRRWLSAA